MRTSVFIATSLDGFIARRDGGLDWLPADGGEPHGYDEFIATVDVVVIGRRTFETVLAFAAWPYGARQVVVLSGEPSALRAPAGAVCEFAGGMPAEIVARLAGRGFEHAYVDGGVTIQRFLAAGLIDRVVITRVPVLLGDGIPLFGALPRDVRFEHVGTRAYPSGLVSSEYRRALQGPEARRAWMIYHIVAEADYRSRNDGRQYLPAGFAADGFVHCALEASVLAVANDYFAGVAGTLLLLRIDPARLTCLTKYEAAAPAPAAGASHLATSPVFPHVYGPIDNAAVDGVGVLAKGEHGYAWPAAFVPLAEHLGQRR